MLAKCNGKMLHHRTAGSICCWRPFCLGHEHKKTWQITIRLITKQSYTNLRLFWQIPTDIEANKIFFTFFKVFFDKRKENLQTQKQNLNPNPHPIYKASRRRAIANQSLIINEYFFIQPNLFISLFENFYEKNRFKLLFQKRSPWHFENNCVTWSNRRVQEQWCPVLVLRPVEAQLWNFTMTIRHGKKGKQLSPFYILTFVLKIIHFFPHFSSSVLTNA